MSRIVTNQQARELLVNMFMSRTSWNNPLLDGPFQTRDIDGECGYPQSISTQDYINMYERGDVASRIVDIEPAECWKEYPEIYETEEERETEFEVALDKVVSETNLYSYLTRIDKASGIGRFGVLFLGFDDGKEWDQPAPGFSEERQLDERGNAKILFYRVLDESGVTIAAYENDQTNRRYGQPTYYTLNFSEHINSSSANGDAIPAYKSVKVHWSRVIHIADNLITSEIYGMPRMQNVFNRLMDLRKILGGSAEMFWKGGFPGLSFEVDPEVGEFTEDEKIALKNEAKQYSEGLQRYLTTVGVSVKPLNIQIANPDSHIDAVLKIIALTKGIPQRLLTGSEQGSLASSQDADTWAERVALRRNMYVTPSIIRPTIDRLIQVGALPVPPMGYSVKWTPLAVLGEEAKAKVGKDLTEALARYSTAGAEALIPLPEFLSKFLKFSFQEVEAIMKAPATELSVIFQELGMTGQQNNVPTSIPNVSTGSTSKDPTKTPQNVVQRKRGTTVKKREGAANPQATKE